MKRMLHVCCTLSSLLPKGRLLRACWAGATRATRLLHTCQPAAKGAVAAHLLG